MAPGQYDPESQAGRELIGHELAHVVQQRQGRVAVTSQVRGIAINDAPGLEQEADALGQRGREWRGRGPSPGPVRRAAGVHHAGAPSPRPSRNGSPRRRTTRRRWIPRSRTPRSSSGRTSRLSGRMARAWSCC
ncbi:MAG: DUF4157 domain-containing protein [Myxococcales bacterium]|nr:DUF4157 domain-containing protein [Myxococcales bacterium]